MPGFPEPQVGLVISYAYLWFEESKRGLLEGAKDRPCVIIVAIDPTRAAAGRGKRIAVAPITHSMPESPNVAIEIPLLVKEHLGLDGERSWVILDEFNTFTWPGYDLRSIRELGGRVDYGFLPPRFFDRLIAKFRELSDEGRVSQASRDHS